MFLNVIIPSYRSKSTILDTIESILSCHPFPGEFDITVVDSSDDDSAEVVAKSFPNVRLIKLPEQAFPGKARNKGVENTKGDILCFIDADAAASPSWLKSIHSFFTEHPQVAAVGGPVLNANPSEGWARLAHWCEFSGYGLKAPEGIRRVVPSVNLAIKRSAFEKYGPFLEDQFGNEDVLLLYRMYRDGAQIHFFHNICVAHKNKTSLRKIYEHQYKLGESTGHARTLYNLPGTFLTRPGFHLLVPVIKTCLIGWRILTQETGDFPAFLLHLPRVFWAMLSFSRGFKHGMNKARKHLEHA